MTRIVSIPVFKDEKCFDENGKEVIPTPFEEPVFPMVRDPGSGKLLCMMNRQLDDPSHHLPSSSEPEGIW